jgi:hypothetical protein
MIDVPDGDTLLALPVDDHLSEFIAYAACIIAQPSRFDQQRQKHQQRRLAWPAKSWRG